VIVLKGFTGGDSFGKTRVDDVRAAQVGGEIDGQARDKKVSKKQTAA
jgi:hypothetical protein